MEALANLSFVELFRDSYIHFLALVVVAVVLATVGKSLPTRRAFLLFLVPLPLAILSFYWSEAAFVSDLYNALLMITLLADRFLLSVTADQIELRRDHAEKFSIHQHNSVVVSWLNNSDIPVKAVVFDHAPPEIPAGDNRLEFSIQMAPHTPGRIEYPLMPMDRGSFAFGKIYLKYQSRLGLLWLMHSGGRQETVEVYPDLKRLHEMRIQFSRGMGAGEIQRRSLGQEGAQFAGLRNYFVGDDSRKIDWRATARTGVPIVQLFTPEVDQPVLILIDGGRKMLSRTHGLTKFDWALNAGLALSGVAIDRGDQVGMGIFNNQLVKNIPLGLGKKHLQVLVEGVYDVSAEAVEPDYEWAMLYFSRQLKRRSLVVIFTDLIDPVASKSLVRSLKVFSSQHLILLVTLSDEETLTLARRYPDTTFDAYEKGVALELIHQRERTLRELARSYGAVVLDTPADQMDEALIHQYMAIKLKNKL